MAFLQRRIDLSFSMANGVFDGGGNNFTATGLRTFVQIGKWGGASMGTLEAAVFGLPLSVMNQLSTVGTQYAAYGQNSVQVMAGDDESGMSLVFSGTIIKAFTDAQSQPDVAFRVSALAGGITAATAAQPTSVQGGADVGQVMGQIAQQAGLAFENNGVSVQMRDLYLWGDLRAQAKELADAAGIQWTIDNDVLAIWPTGSSRQSSTPLISPATGQIGYPAFDSAQLIVKSIFNPNILPGGSIQVQSDLTPACGTWNVLSIDLNLEAQVPRGRWEETITAAPMPSGSQTQQVP